MSIYDEICNNCEHYERRYCCCYLHKCPTISTDGCIDFSNKSNTVKRKVPMNCNKCGKYNKKEHYCDMHNMPVGNVFKCVYWTPERILLGIKGIEFVEWSY